jgi:3',5'-cyclic AMP phosphodiesterase CpdA
MKFVHFGDLHVWSRCFAWRELQYPKRWIGPLNLWLNRRKRFPPGYRLPAVDAIIKEQTDIAVFTGDFTTFALREEFVMASALIERIFEKVGDGFIAIPGNHDRYTEAAIRKGHLEHYLTFLPEERVFTKQLAPRITVVAVDHSYPFLLRSNGIVKEDVHNQLIETLERMRKTNQIVILMGHYPFVTPWQHKETWQHKLIGEEKMLEVVKEFKPKLYLHGHKHVRWSYRPQSCPDTLCLNCGSIGMKSDSREKQAGYLTWDMDERGDIRKLTAKVYDGHSEWVPHAMNVD